MQQPGFLTDLEGAGVLAWETKLADMVSNANTEAWNVYLSKLNLPAGSQPARQDHLVADGSSSLLPGLAVIDWNGFPVRVERCITTQSQAFAFLDRSGPAGDTGRFIGQEEYLEWRSVRNGAGKLVRVELTTENLEYWTEVAAHHPAKMLKLCGAMARGADAPWQEVYASDPFAPGASDDDRRLGFLQLMAEREFSPPLSPYNNGVKAICFLGQRFNALVAAVILASYAARRYGKMVGGVANSVTGREAIASGTQQAEDCRNSDPTIVDSVLGLAWQGKKLALADPVGLYIHNVNQNGLLVPDGSAAVPSSWVTLSRGKTVDIAGTTYSFFQRLVVEAPAGAGEVLGDLIEASTGDHISSGAQIARLVTVALYARASADNAITLPAAFPSFGALPNCEFPSAAKCAPFTIGAPRPGPQGAAPPGLDDVKGRTRRDKR